MYKRLFGDRDPVAEPGTETGTPGNWWTVFANSPDVLEHACRGFALYASPDRKVKPKLRELGQTRAGWLVGSQFVFSQHCKSCRALGFSEGATGLAVLREHELAADQPARARLAELAQLGLHLAVGARVQRE